MKVIALGKIAQNKFCNLSPGTVFSFLNEHLEVEPEIYIKIELLPPKEGLLAAEGAVNLKTGKMLQHFHRSSRCKIYQDACIVLDPIDRD